MEKQKNTIERDKIYAGILLKVKNTDFYTVVDDGGMELPCSQFTYSTCRTIIYAKQDGTYKDLLYDTPKFTVLSKFHKPYTELNKGELVVVEEMNLGFLLKELGFPEHVTGTDINKFKKIFNPKNLKDLCHIFGYEVIDFEDLYTKLDLTAEEERKFAELKADYTDRHPTSIYRYECGDDINSQMKDFHKLCLLLGRPNDNDKYKISRKNNVLKPSIQTEGIVKVKTYNK